MGILHSVGCFQESFELTRISIISGRKPRNLIVHIGTFAIPPRPYSQYIMKYFSTSILSHWSWVHTVPLYILAQRKSNNIQDMHVWDQKIDRHNLTRNFTFLIYCESQRALVLRSCFGKQNPNSVKVVYQLIC